MSARKGTGFFCTTPEVMSMQEAYKYIFFRSDDLLCWVDGKEGRYRYVVCTGKRCDYMHLDASDYCYPSRDAACDVLEETLCILERVTSKWLMKNMNQLLDSGSLRVEELDSVLTKEVIDTIITALRSDKAIITSRNSGVETIEMIRQLQENGVTEVEILCALQQQVTGEKGVPSNFFTMPGMTLRSV